jgi:hypothetical protein
VGGLLISQLLTLYTTPVIYLFMERVRLRFARKSDETHDRKDGDVPDVGDEPLTQPGVPIAMEPLARPGRP